MESLINDSFKQASEGVSGVYTSIGHYMPLMAEITPDFIGEYGNQWPHVGQVLIVNEKDQSWEIPCNIEFTYEYAVLSGWTTGYTLNKSYDKPVWTSGYSGVGHLTIPTGTRMFSQHLFTGYIYNIKNISVSDPVQSLKFYMLGDDGIRLIYGMNNEHNRDILDKTVKSLFVSPPECVLCEGSGLYQGLTCPQCGGTKYIGYNAEGWLLTNKAKELGIIKRSETERSFQHRAWARKQWTNPNVTGVINYVNLVTGVPIDKIEMEVPTGMKELIYYIRFPLAAGGTAALGEGGVAQDFVFGDIGTIQEVVDEISPAGTNAVVEPYYLLRDASEMVYQNGYANPIVIQIDNMEWYSDWTITGVINGSGWITSGVQSNYTQSLTWFDPNQFYDGVDHFYDYLNTGEFSEIFRYDNVWIVTGTTGYYTGTLEDGFTGIFVTGTTASYKSM